MKPMTSSTATGSLKPDSPSSVRASRRRSVDPRSSAKIAAPSVDASTEPSSRPCSHERSNSQHRCHADHQRGEERGAERERERGAEDGADLRPAGGQPALEEDERERDDPHGRAVS